MNEFTPDGANTSPFHTIDAFDGSAIDELLMVLDAEAQDFNGFITAHPDIAARISAQEIPEPGDRTAIPWDDANLIFVATCPASSKQHPPLGQGHARNRMGRIPYGDGDAIGYLMLFLRPPADESGSNMMQRISMLHSGFSSSLHGHGRFSHGSWGMHLRGYLSLEEVGALQLDMKNVKWSVSPDEPLEAGVRTIVKDLNVILRAATRQGTGVLFRSHA